MLQRSRSVGSNVSRSNLVREKSTYLLDWLIDKLRTKQQRFPADTSEPLLPRANWDVCWTERDWKLPNCLSVGLSHAHARICRAACLPELHRGKNCQSSVRGSRTCPGPRIRAQPMEPMPDMQCLSGHTTHRHGKAWSIHGVHFLLQWERCDVKTHTPTKSARSSSSSSSKHDQQRAWKKLHTVQLYRALVGKFVNSTSHSICPDTHRE